jgi:hypothetical protein
MGESRKQQHSDDRTPIWAGLTPAGQRLVVERERDDWIVRCDSKAVRGHLLEAALIEAISGDFEAHWFDIDRARYAHVVASSILSPAQTR